MRGQAGEAVHACRGRAAVACLRRDDDRRVFRFDHVEGMVVKRVRGGHRDRMSKRLVHVVRHSVEREWLTVHGPRSRAVRTGRFTAEERRRRVGKRVAGIVSDVGESETTLHAYIVRVAHGDVVSVRGLGYRVRPAVVVSGLVVGGLLGMVNLAAELLLGHVVLVELVEEGAARTRGGGRSSTGCSTFGWQP